MKSFFLIICLLILNNPVFAAESTVEDDQYLFTELTKIAESGNPEAQYHLGMLYNNGIGTEKDIAQAFYWFEKAASAGHPLGHYKVGCYYSGQGKGVIELDKDKALEHKLIAAEAGYVRAQYDVAANYYQDKKMNKALAWWEKAANQGYPDAVFALSALYFGGKGIPRDVAKAYDFLKIIEKNIGEENRHRIEPQLKELESELSPDQLEEAVKSANNWKAEKTPLTIKAYAGKKESRRIVEENRDDK